MAQKVEIHLEDDLDGGPADHTLTFALDGKDYEIDLSDANAEKLRKALRPFVAAARKAPTGNGRRKRGTGTSSSSSETATISADMPSTVISPSVSKPRKSTRITLTTFVPPPPGTAAAGGLAAGLREGA